MMEQDTFFIVIFLLWCSCHVCSFLCLRSEEAFHLASFTPWCLVHFTKKKRKSQLLNADELPCNSLLLVDVRAKELVNDRLEFISNFCITLQLLSHCPFVGITMASPKVHEQHKVHIDSSMQHDMQLIKSFQLPLGSAMIPCSVGQD